MRNRILTGAVLTATMLGAAPAAWTADAPPTPPSKFNGRWAAPGARCFGRGVDVIEVGGDHVAMPDGVGPITAVQVLNDREVEITVRTSPGGGAAVVTRPVRLALSADGSTLTQAGTTVARTRCDAPAPTTASAPPPPRVTAPPPLSSSAPPAAARTSPYADIGACMWREIGEGARNKIRKVLGVRVSLEEVVAAYKSQGTYDLAVSKCDPEYKTHTGFTESLFGTHAIRIVALDYFAELSIDENRLLTALKASPSTRKQLWLWMLAAFDEKATEMPEVNYGEVTRRLQLDADASDVAGTFFQFDALENYLLYDEISPPGGPITPTWLHRPTVAEIDANYPAGVGVMPVQPRVSMTCVVGKEGRFSRCDIETEAPQGKGFGRAAQQVAKFYRLDPWSREGEPMEDSTIRITITFGDPPQSRAPAPAPRVRPNTTPPPPLVIETTRKQDRVEYEGPPVIVPGPPPPPAPPAPPRPYAVTNPQWVRKPTGADMVRLYPPQARKDELDGRATVECTVTRDGRLTGCFVISETPAGAGFGAASVAAMVYFRMAPRTIDGQSVEGARVRVPLTWRMG